MNFAHMPAAKWVVKENTIYNGSPAIQNQESGWWLNNGAYRVIDVKEDGTVVLYMKYYNYQDKVAEDLTVKLTPVTEVNDYGYIHKGFSANTDSIFTLNYLNVTGGLSVQIGAGNDTILRVAEGEGTQFILETATKDAVKYGVGVAAVDWKGVSEKKKSVIDKATSSIAKKIIHNSANVKPGIKTKGMFWIMHLMQKNGFNPRDVEHWKSKGWTEKKRPWK